MIGIDVLILIFVCFFLALLMTGGWDDIPMGFVASLPLVALIALGVAMMNVSKYKSEGRELVGAIVTLACSTIFAGLAMIYPILVLAIEK